MRLIRATAIVGLFSIWPNLAFAVPNQPAPTQAINVSDKLASTYAQHDIEGYERLFDPDVHVYQDGVLIASNRAEWLTRIKKEFHGPWKIERDLSAPEQAQILVAETVSNYGDPADGAVHDCCHWARIGRYNLNPSFKIVDVRFFSNTLDTWQEDRRPRP